MTAPSDRHPCRWPISAAGLSHLAAVCVFLLALAIRAQPGAPAVSSAATEPSPTADAASVSERARRIHEVFEEHFLVADFAAAEAALLAIIQGCDASCSRAELALGWMYVGIVRAGAQDADGATTAFEQALVLDPEIRLDVDVANATAQALFLRAGGEVDGEVAVPPASSQRPDKSRSARELRAAAAKNGLVCGPGAGRLETRRPLPVWCEHSERFWRVTLRYLAFNADGWMSLRMNREGSRFQVQIPCSKTQFAGPLKYYVTVTDSEGALVATLGSRREPLVVQVMENVDTPAPAFPGRLPAERCPVEETCPPDFPGCDDGNDARGSQVLGEACTHTRECESGLTCASGVCEPSPSCDVDSDCPGAAARCVDRVCQGSGRPLPEQRARSFYGLHFAADLGPVAGNDVCTTQNTDFDCRLTDSGRSYPGTLPEELALEPGEPGDAYPGASVGGLARGSLRLLLSYDREIGEQLTLGARLGVAFNGAPAGVDEPAFLPVHLEARVSYWLFGSAPTQTRPFFSLVGGLAQVDLSKKLVVRDCSSESSRRRFEDCISAEGDYETAPASLPELEVTATRRLGRGFAGLGVGAFVPLYRNFGAVPALNAQVTFPHFGFVIQPSVGLAAAF